PAEVLVQRVDRPGHARAGEPPDQVEVAQDIGISQAQVSRLEKAAIAKIKELDPEMTTAHAVMMTWSDYAYVEDSDHLSAEIGTVTPFLVHQLHQAGMKVFCWTADDPSDIQYLVSCGVDVIGTDDPVMVSEKLKAADCSGGVRRCFYLMMHVLADMQS
ncbi:MAG: hypothetical protein IKD69_12115, partial [Solobacterium sp.]|nr:hypothetical protein [Solobacterium sp.]